MYWCIMTISRSLSLLVYLFNVVVLFNVIAHAEVCEETENGIIFRDPLKDRRLENNLLRTVSTLSIVECSLECLRERCCLSVNYGKDLNNMKEHECELNEAKVSTNPEDITRNSSYVYYEIMDTGTGFRAEPCSKALGSSKDLPGKSCKDIKQRTNTCISKEYWIKPTDTATPFLAYCEMKLYEGGWTLVYSYTFTNYSHFYTTSNAVDPRPSWNAPEANVNISKEAPLKNKHGAIDFDYWQHIGDEFFIRSNINNWYKCQPDGGSLVGNTNGSITCQILTDIGVSCNETIIPQKIVWDSSGPVLRSAQTRSIYRFDGSTSTAYPTHNSCESSTKNHKKGVANPYGQLFIK